MSLDPRLVAILRCPDVHKAPLTYENDRLTCTECGRTFDVDNGVIPVMLLEEAKTS